MSVTTKPLSIWDKVAHCFFGIERRAEGKCFYCGHQGTVIDLGDSDFICDPCWINWSAHK